MNVAPLNPSQDKYSNNEPQDQANKESLMDILSDFKVPLSRRQLQKELHARCRRYPELGSLCIPLILLERENRISWIKLKCSITGIKCKHYFKLPCQPELGKFWNWDTEEQKLVLQGDLVKKAEFIVREGIQHV